MNREELIREFEAEHPSETDWEVFQSWLIDYTLRLRNGQWTQEEIHDLCHDLPSTVPLEEFAKGCSDYQLKLYNASPHLELLASADKLFKLAYGGDWISAPEDWRLAAVTWRAAYVKLLNPDPKAWHKLSDGSPEEGKIVEVTSSQSIITSRAIIAHGAWRDWRTFEVFDPYLDMEWRYV